MKVKLFVLVVFKNSEEKEVGWEIVFSQLTRLWELSWSYDI